MTSSNEGGTTSLNSLFEMTNVSTIFSPDKYAPGLTFALFRVGVEFMGGKKFPGINSHRIPNSETISSLLFVFPL